MKYHFIIITFFAICVQNIHGRVSPIKGNHVLPTKNVDILQHSSDLPTSRSVMIASTEVPTKSYWYMAILPIYPKELLKFFSLSMMMFWIVFVFTMTRDTKDALIVTNCGAEAIAFLKVFGI